MITLGSLDEAVEAAAVEAYVQFANKLTGVPEWGAKLRGEKEGEWVNFQKAGEDDMKVAEVQQFLKQAGFFPHGRIDGICGYRTASSIRLFQEYVRTVEGNTAIGFPDGKLGSTSQEHIRRWQAGGLKADWLNFSSQSPSPECSKWLALLRKIKEKNLAQPSRMQQLINKFSQSSDTLKVADWELGAEHLHLIGIRRNQADPGEPKFDDVFVLLINGMAFKFFGSTEPGHTSNDAGFPFLAEGQHKYRFGWHKLSDQNRVYHALKPLSSGVLVVRSKDQALTDADLAKGLERNNSINIHWGGEGLGRLGAWSEGCQVIVGKAYVNHREEVVNCTKFAAPNYAGLGTVAGDIYQTKGAYTILEDVVTAHSSDDNVVHYFLLNESDLALHPDIGIAKAKELLARV